jgi:hypothetical protein
MYVEFGYVPELLKQRMLASPEWDHLSEVYAEANIIAGK